MNTFGDNVRYYRKKAGLTQLQLGQALGYKSQTAIAKVESNERNVPSSIIEKMANVLDCSPADFYSPTEDDLREYLPYLRNCSDATREAVRKLLDMPPLKKTELPSSSTKEA